MKRSGFEGANRLAGPIIAAVCTAVLVGGFVVVSAQSPGSETINACVGKLTGLVRIVDEGERCLRTEKSVEWAKQGPAGLPGPQGVPGPQGEPGPQGPAGPAGTGNLSSIDDLAGLSCTRDGFPGLTTLVGNDDGDIVLRCNAVDGDADGHLPPADCDDADADIYPGAPEVFDGVDNDCDGKIDESATILLLSEHLFEFPGEDVYTIEIRIDGDPGDRLRIDSVSVVGVSGGAEFYINPIGSDPCQETFEAVTTCPVDILVLVPVTSGEGELRVNWTPVDAVGSPGDPEVTTARLSAFP